MASAYDAKQVKIKAIRDDVIVTDMNFGEVKLNSGIILRSDNAKAHGVHPRWGRVYKVGPRQESIKEGQWILVEHGRWTRASLIDDGEGERQISRVEVESILAVSDTEPSETDKAFIGQEI